MNGGRPVRQAAVNTRRLARHALLALLLGWSGACSRPPEQQFIHDVASALGGTSAVQDVGTLLIESGDGDGESYYVGENKTPTSEYPVFRTVFRQAFDWNAGRLRKEELRTPTFLTGSQGTRQLTIALDGDIAFDIPADQKAVRQPEWVARERRAELHMHPIGLVRAALAAGATIGPIATSGTSQSSEIRLPDGSVLTLVVDAKSKLPSRIATRIGHPILGDVVEAIDFADYASTGGVMLPASTTVRVDDHVVARFRARTQQVNVDMSGTLPDAAFAGFTKRVRLEVPPVLKSAPVQPPPPVVATAIAPGIWYLTGGQYYSVLVEFADHLTLIEAPVDDRRTTALLEQAQSLVPGKKVTDLVITHHHFDHIGGVRAAVAAGLTLIVHGEASSAAGSGDASGPPPAGSSAAFFADLARRPHTIVPDALAGAPRAATIRTVGDRLTLHDATRTMELYPITGSGYADTLLMAYLPHEKLLVEADVYSPPAPGGSGDAQYPFAANLVENIHTRGLAVERIVPLHGQIVPLASLVSAAELPVTPPGGTSPSS
jgi:hypothetical protein